MVIGKYNVYLELARKIAIARRCLGEGDAGVVMMLRTQAYSVRSVGGLILEIFKFSAKQQMLYSLKLLARTAQQDRLSSKRVKTFLLQSLHNIPQTYMVLSPSDISRQIFLYSHLSLESSARRILLIHSPLGLSEEVA